MSFRIYSIPRLFVFQGVAGIMEKYGDDNIIVISAIVVAGIVLVLIICVIIILICRRQRQAGKCKYPIKNSQAKYTLFFHLDFSSFSKFAFKGKWEVTFGCLTKD